MRFDSHPWLSSTDAPMLKSRFIRAMNAKLLADDPHFSIWKATCDFGQPPLRGLKDPVPCLFVDANSKADDARIHDYLFRTRSQWRIVMCSSPESLKVLKRLRNQHAAEYEYTVTLS